MAPVYREIELQWEGKTYKVTPNYQMIQRIEQTISIGPLLRRALNGSAPNSQLADLLSMALREAGCRADSADAEAINAELYDPENVKRVTSAAIAVMIAVLPQTEKPQRGNAPAPAAGAPSPTSSGPSTTPSPSD